MWSSPLRRAALLTGAAVALIAPPAAAQTPRVDAMVVDPSGRAAAGPARVALRAVTVRSGSRRCRLRAGLALNVLSLMRVPFGARGDCDALYVFQVRGHRETGRSGWVYKVGRRLPSRSASDPTGVLRSGQRLVWFWCRQAGNCQRTLAMAAPRSVRRGVRFRVTVRGYDDFGRGRRIRGAVVRYDGQAARTNRSGVAVLRPRRPGRLRLVVTRRGMIRSFSSVVTVR